jgi:hypothetical protein
VGVSHLDHRREDGQSDRVDQERVHLHVHQRTPWQVPIEKQAWK